MNDFDYENLQKKRLAQSAKKKVNGAYSKKCSLPSDGMTNKQWKERNGEVITYNISKPMSWEEFKALPVDLQGNYIMMLQNEYDASQRAIAKMFGVQNITLMRHITNHGIKAHFPPKEQGKHMDKAAKAKWNRFLAGASRAEADEAPAEATESAESVFNEATAEELAPRKEAVQAQPMPSKSDSSMRFDGFTLRFSGAFNRAAVANSLAAILQDGQRVQITINFEVID